MLRKLVVFLTLGVLLMPYAAVEFPVRAMSADSMWIEPSSLDLSCTPVGAKFNVTVWLNVTSPTYLWQIYLIYKKAHLNATCCGLTGNGKSLWSGAQPIQPPPQPDFGDHNETHGYVLLGEALSAGNESTGVGSLAWIEFQTMPAGGANGQIQGTLKIDVRDFMSFYSYAVDKDLIEIPLTFGNAAYTNVVHGPWMDNLYIKYFGSSSAVFDALVNNEVDLTDVNLNQAQRNIVFNDTNIRAAVAPSFTLYAFEFNNNATTPTYPDWVNPTAFKEFRQGIACLVNKTYVTSNLANYSYRIDTPIPRPDGDWWVDWSVSEYDSYGNLIGNYPYEYDSDQASTYFDLAGFVDGNAAYLGGWRSEPGTSNPYYDESFPASSQYIRVYPQSHSKSGQDLDPLNFLIRSDDVARLEAGGILRDNLRKMGIPLNSTEVTRSQAVNKVMRQGDYHIYTGGWVWDSPPSPAGFELLDLYTSERITPDLMTNYVQFRNATYDDLVHQAENAPNVAIAKEATVTAQKIIVEEAASVWLYSLSDVMGYRNIYRVTDSRGAGIGNTWTFLQARKPNASDTYINYGLAYQPASLNVITDYGTDAYSSECLDRIYSTLLSYSPYDTTPEIRGGAMPWMAQDWEVEEWESPYEPGKNLTKLTFYLRNGLRWHDEVELNSSDVKFTIEYLKGLGGNVTYLFNLVSDVDHITTPDATTVAVYVNATSIWAVNRIGTLPILPRHIFQNISNVTGYTPGADQGLPANQTLVGSGPWKYVSDNSSMLVLQANRAYFMEVVPVAEIDFRYDWELGGWVVDNMDAAMIGESYGTSGKLVPSVKWEPGCDVYNGEGVVNIQDAIVLAAKFNMTWGKSAKRYIPPPPTDTAVFVEPLGNPILVGQSLTVYAKMLAYNSTKLSGVQFKLGFDKDKLSCLDLTINPFFGNATTIQSKAEINQTEGYVWVSVSALGETQGLSGNTTLATMTFNATKPSGSTLDLWSTKLASYGMPGMTSQFILHNTFDRSVMVGVSTPSGENVTVAPAEKSKVTFTNATTEGVTTLNITQAPSNEFVSVLCQDIETTVNYTGDITIQFEYDPTGLSLEDELATRIWMWNETSQAWVDITSWVDTDNNTVYGVAPHLSMFGVTRCLNVVLNATQPGETTVSTPEDPPDPPTGLTALGYYEIKTTAVYTGPVNIRLQYSEEAVPPGTESFVQVWQWEESLATWVDITTSVDTVSNVVYGSASHLSMFGVTSIKPVGAKVAVVNSEFSKTVVGRGYNVTISVTFENQGDFRASTVDAFVYANNTVVGGTTILNLAPNYQQAIVVEWNATGFDKGNYTVTACGRTLGWVYVSVPGDVTSITYLVPEGRVDMRDIGAICGKFMRTPSSSDWNRNFDINDDGVINMRDIGIACNNFMKP